MKILNKIIFLILVMTSSGAMAQASLDSLLQKVESGNPALINARHLMEARQMEASTGLTPANPEVEFAYLWGNPADMGNRTDFGVTQTFDFPTVYSSRKQLSDIDREQAGLEYLATRQEVLMKARKAWINRVHLNKVSSLLESRLSYANLVAKGFERKLETGEANRLELNQARMKVTALKNDISLLEQKFSQNEAELMNLTGNSNVLIADTLLFPFVLINLDSLLSEYQDSYISRIYRSEVAKKDKEVDVTFNKKLPKLKAGYYSESILGTRLQGIQAGISIPLWENARAVKSAKARLVYASSGAEAYWNEKQNTLTQTYQQWVLLKARVEEMDKLLRDANDEALLRQAMESGEISLTNYFYESDFYFQNLLNLLEFEKEMRLKETELLKVRY